MSKYEELVARGMIAQTTNEAQVKELIDNGKLASLADEYGISESELIK